MSRSQWGHGFASGASAVAWLHKKANSMKWKMRWWAIRHPIINLKVWWHFAVYKRPPTGKLFDEVWASLPK